MAAAEPTQGLPSFGGRYHALFRIAAGGMAEVYAARVGGHVEFTKIVAVKRMLPHLAAEEQFVDMFLDEARVAANISSPNVVSTLELGRAEDGALYIVMEFVVGVTLSTLLRNEIRAKRRMPLNIGIDIVGQAARGLDDAHNARTPTGTQLGIIHRDVSPQNVLVDIDGRARVTDFGIARAILRRTATNTGQLKGKFAYFSPEQATGIDLDRRSDVFSLGIVAWETLTCRRLFHHDENPLATLERIKNEAIRSPKEARRDLPDEICAVVLKALERDPDKRYSSAAEFEAAMREASSKLCEPPTRAQFGEWVREAGGEELSSLQSALEQALAGADEPTVAGQAAIVKAIAEEPTRDIVSEVRARLEEAQTTIRISGDLGTAEPNSRSVSNTTRIGRVVPASKWPWIALVSAAAVLMLLVGIFIGRLLGGGPDVATPSVPFVPTQPDPAMGSAPTPSSPAISPVAQLLPPATTVQAPSQMPPLEHGIVPAPLEPRHASSGSGSRPSTSQRPAHPLPPATTTPDRPVAIAGTRPGEQAPRTTTQSSPQPPNAGGQAPQTGSTSNTGSASSADPRPRQGSGLIVPIDVFDQQAGGSHR